MIQHQCGISLMEAGGERCPVEPSTPDQLLARAMVARVLYEDRLGDIRTLISGRKMVMTSSPLRSKSSRSAFKNGDTVLSTSRCAHSVESCIGDILLGMDRISSRISKSISGLVQTPEFLWPGIRTFHIRSITILYKANI